MEGFDEKLSEEVRKYPHLYDSSLKEYRNLMIVQNSWQEIAKDLMIEVDVAKKKWKYLRECYVKSKKFKKGKSGDARPSNPNKHSKMLEWLSPFIKHRVTKSSMSIHTESIESAEQRKIVEEELSSAPACFVRSIPLAPNEVSCAEIPLEQRITGKHPRTETANAILQYSREREVEDEFTNFGKIVADTLRKLPRISQILVKKKINDVLFEAEMEAMGRSCEKFETTRDEDCLETASQTDSHDN